MEHVLHRLHRWEFEARIFVSFGIVILVAGGSALMFGDIPSTLELTGSFFGLSAPRSLMLGYAAVAAILAAASVLRMWAGSLLTPPTVMAFRVRTEQLRTAGPYRLTRNPIYLADLLAICAFAVCLPATGLMLPLLFLVHYHRLISYEERSLQDRFRDTYAHYAAEVPRFLPRLSCLRSLPRALKEFSITVDGFRHNALFVLFVPGFIVGASTHAFLDALAIGIPGLIDWAVIHTKIGWKK